jgi:RHS repeat-associated protein
LKYLIKAGSLFGFALDGQIDSSGLSYYGARYLASWLTRWISPDAAGAVDGLNLYVYVGNNPLKYIDPTGHVKVYPMDKGEPHELDVLSPIEGTYRSDSMFHFPESYERLEGIVRTYSSNKLDLLNDNTKFIIESKDSKGALTIKAHSLPSSTSEFENIMNFSTGQLTFDSNFRDKNCTSGLNATEVISYQYLGMTKIAKYWQFLKRIYRYRYH